MTYCGFLRSITSSDAFCQTQEVGESSRTQAFALMGIFARNDAYFTARTKDVGESSKQTKTVLAQTHAQCQFGGKAIIAELTELGVENSKALAHNEIAQGLDIPRIKMKIRFRRVKSSIFRLFFEGDVQQNFSARF